MIDKVERILNNSRPNPTVSVPRVVNVESKLEPIDNVRKFYLTGNWMPDVRLDDDNNMVIDKSGLSFKVLVEDDGLHDFIQSRIDETEFSSVPDKYQKVRNRLWFDLGGSVLQSGENKFCVGEILSATFDTNRDYEKILEEFTMQEMGFDFSLSDIIEFNVTRNLSGLSTEAKVRLNNVDFERDEPAHQFSTNRGRFGVDKSGDSFVVISSVGRDVNDMVVEKCDDIFEEVGSGSEHVLVDGLVFNEDEVSISVSRFVEYTE